MSRLRGTLLLVLVLAFGAGALAGQLSRPESAFAEQFCAGKTGYFWPYEGTELIFTQTYRTFASTNWSASFWALRRRPNYTIAVSVSGWISPWDFQNSIDVPRRSEMGRTNDYPWYEIPYNLFQYAKGSC